MACYSQRCGLCHLEVNDLEIFLIHKQTCVTESLSIIPEQQTEILEEPAEEVKVIETALSEHPIIIGHTSVPLFDALFHLVLLYFFIVGYNHLSANTIKKIMLDLLTYFYKHFLKKCKFYPKFLMLENYKNDIAFYLNSLVTGNAIHLFVLCRKG